MRFPGKPENVKNTASPGGTPADGAGKTASSADFVEFVRQEAPDQGSTSTNSQAQRQKGHSVGLNQGPRERAVLACFLQLAQGRVGALNILYEVIGKDLFGYIRSIVGNSPDAEDIFQEVFARLAGMQSKAIRIEKPLNYVYVMARNEAFKALKKRGEHRETPFEDGFLEAVSPRVSGNEELTPEEAEKALGLLPVEQREVVVLKIYEGFTFAQIGELTQVSPNTAASRYRYALEKLAERLGRRSGSV